MLDIYHNRTLMDFSPAIRQRYYTCPPIYHGAHAYLNRLIDKEQALSLMVDSLATELESVRAAYLKCMERDAGRVVILEKP